jgi:predicted nucleic acid-binding protein
MASIVIQDACVLINLLASGRFDDIAGGCGLNIAIAATVAKETMYLHNSAPNEREKINLTPLFENGMLQILAAESENEKLRYIELALNLDDGEAESVAIAEARKFALATDDKKARNLIQKEGLKIELWSTCALLQHWQNKCSIPNDEMKSILTNIFSRARYRPKSGHPNFDWWTNILSK